MGAMNRADPTAVVAALRTAGCVFAEDEARLLIDAATGPQELDSLVARRVAGLPLEHLLGWAEFDGLRIAVGPGVFVPRRRTGALVGEAVALLRDRPEPVVLDLCCGTGAIGAAVAARLARPVELHAAEIDPVAAACARRNVEPLGGQVHVGDLDEPLPPRLRGRVGVLVANVPYVPTDAIVRMPPEARDHEPATALDGGADGLDVARRVAALAPGWLAAGGHLLIETSRAQADPLAERYAAAGLAPRIASDDELGATLVVGTLAGR